MPCRSHSYHAKSCPTCISYCDFVWLLLSEKRPEGNVYSIARKDFFCLRRSPKKIRQRKRSSVRFWRKIRFFHLSGKFRSCMNGPKVVAQWTVPISTGFSYEANINIVRFWLRIPPFLFGFSLEMLRKKFYAFLHSAVLVLVANSTEKRIILGIVIFLLGSESAAGEIYIFITLNNMRFFIEKR